MLLRALPLIVGCVPIVGINLAFLLGVGSDILPACNPYFEGCVSISATGRQLPGALMFRGTMFPQAALLAILWYFTAAWLRALQAVPPVSTLWLLMSGFAGALALILYVAFLGTEQPFYEFMRRIGVYFYFFGTWLAQLLCARALMQITRGETNSELRPLANLMVWICALPCILGIANVTVPYMLAEKDQAQNVIEWIVALLMQGNFFVLYAAWVKSGFRVTVTTR